MRVSRFVLIQGKLYKKSMAGPYLWCLEDHEAIDVLKDIRWRYYGNYTGGRSLCSKILRTGYYWPTMKKDAFLHAHKCDSSQRHSNIIYQSAEPLHPFISSLPFIKWGMNIAGKLPKAPGGNVFMLVMKDYFSRCIEVEAFVQERDKQVVSFIKHNILTRFGIPTKIIWNNRS